MSNHQPIIINDCEIGIVKDNKKYIYLSTIVNIGKYESGKYYIKKRCKTIGITLYFSDCIELNDLKNFFIKNTNGIHKRSLLLFIQNKELL